jgi:hypothetical protein
MVTSIRTILIVLAFLLFIFSAFGVKHNRIEFGWLGLAILTAALWLRP